MPPRESTSICIVDDTTPKKRQIIARNLSLGVGSLSANGAVISFTPRQRRRSSSTTTTIVSEEEEESPSCCFLRHKSSFLRVSDLEMKQKLVVDQEPNYHCASSDPPPGMTRDPKETWVALDDGAGNHAPVAPLAIQALADYGYRVAFSNTMWEPADSKTKKLVKTGNPMDGNDFGNDVLIWSGSFSGCYGSELPAVRAAGIVRGMTPKALMELLVDSTRVQEYNKYSLGRTDLLTLSTDIDNTTGPFGGSVTKLMCSKSRALSRTMEFVSILHAKPIPDGGYLLVTRAVTYPMEDTNVTRSEILVGVNVLRPIGDSDCLMINVNHVRSPGLPLMIAKRVGFSAAANFIHDLRGVN